MNVHPNSTRSNDSSKFFPISSGSFNNTFSLSYSFVKQIACPLNSHSLFFIVVINRKYNTPYRMTHQKHSIEFYWQVGRFADCVDNVKDACGHLAEYR